MARFSAFVMTMDMMMTRPGYLGARAELGRLPRSDR